MKKIITLLLTCLLICIIAVPCLADEVPTVTLTASANTVNAGDTITITVSISETANCTSVGLGITYDTDAFEMIENSFKELVANTQANCKYNSIAGGYVANIQLESTQTVSGNLFTFQLKVKDGAKMNVSYSISGIPSIRVNGTAISGNVKAATITVACTHSYDNDCDTTCNLCGATRTVSHTWDDGTDTTAATCTAEGVKTYTCKECGTTKTESVKKTDHNYESKVTTEATCTAEGVKTYTCTTCGENYTETIKKLAHSDESAVTTEATCTTEGVKTVTCSVCGRYYTEAIKKLDHSYESTLTTEATCTTEGVKTVTCSVCGKSYTEVIEKLSHSYDHDCDADCNICGETRETEHNYNNRWSSDETGHWHECTICGDVLELIPHTPGPEPTEEEDQICLDCGYVLQPVGTHIHAGIGDWLSDDFSHWHLCACGENLDAADHVWNEGTRNEEAGVITYLCTVCGQPKTETVEEPTETTPATSESPTTEPSSTEDQPNDQQEPFPWRIVIPVVAVLLIAAVVFIIIGVLKSKKQTGKYSG